MAVLIVTEAAVHLQCSPEAIYRLLRLKKLQSKSVNPTKVDTNEVERLLVSRNKTISQGSDQLRTARGGWRE